MLLMVEKRYKRWNISPHLLTLSNLCGRTTQQESAVNDFEWVEKHLNLMKIS